MPIKSWLLLCGLVGALIISASYTSLTLAASSQQTIPQPTASPTLLTATPPTPTATPQATPTLISTPVPTPIFPTATPTALATIATAVPQPTASSTVLTATPTTPTDTPQATPTATLSPTGLSTATPLATPISPQPTSTPAPTGGADLPCTNNPWRFTTNMTTQRAYHVLLVANNQFYAMGGWNDSGVERAIVNADGSLALWQRENVMTTLRGELAGVAHNGFLYALGGTYGDSGRTTEFAPIHADGSLGTWQQSTSMIEARAYFAAIAHNGFLYAIGGDNHSPATVERAPIHADGSLGAWEPAGTMNYARKSRNAAVIGNFLYIFGDSPSASQADTIERTALYADGTIGSWQVIGTLPVSRSNPAVVATNAFVYLIGGHVELTDYQSVIQMPILADGTLGAARFLQDLHRERQAPTALIYNGHLYVAGGADYPNGSDESVEWAALSNLGAPRNNGITINNGALFTNATAVTLSITGQTGVMEMAVSNDGGFAGAAWEPCRATKDWMITSFGNSILPRTVYVRYRDAQGAVSSVVQDDIILDVTAPSGSVNIVPLTSVQQRGGGQTIHLSPSAPVQQTSNPANPLYLPLIATSRSNCPQTGSSTVTLHLNAQDDVSGVKDMLISNTGSFTCADWQPFAASQIWYVPSGATTTVYVKFRDHAGNISVAVQDTVTLTVK